MVDQSITLYGYATSPFVMKVAAYLKYKKLEYQHVHVRPVTIEQIAFTGQRQVPVLKIGDQWQVNSSPLGHWLDEIFPERPILPKNPDNRAKVIEADDWITSELIPSRFREAVDWDNPLRSIMNGWRLAQIVHGGTKLPLAWRLMWPFALRRAPFIQKLANQTDRSESMPAMRKRIMDKFEEKLDGGPFLGSQNQVSLADLSAYPILISPWLLGMKGKPAWLARPHILDWMRKVQATLPSNPLPADDQFLTRDFL